ncbi:MAG: calcium/proton exchanger [Isosphaeraceae bacterium]
MKRLGLLAFIPLAIGLHLAGVSPIVVFAASALALVPLASFTEQATESLAEDLGPTWGGLLSASLGNAPEIIIGFFALRQGLVDVVKSSLIGSIVGNLLFALGLSMFVGGLRNGAQHFDRKVAGMNCALLTLAGAGMIIPAVFHHSSRVITQEISLQIAGMLFVVYLGSLVFTLAAGRTAIVQATAQPVEEGHESEPRWGRNRSIGILAAVTIGLAIMSEILTDALEPASEMMGLTPIFSGVFLLAVVGNVAQIFNAVSFARSNRMDLALGVTVGSSIQVALVVAPVLMFASLMLGQPMDLVFSRFEIVALALSVLVVRQLIDDGQSNWLEGLMLMAVYFMLGVGFYFLRPGPIAGN